MSLKMERGRVPTWEKMLLTQNEGPTETLAITAEVTPF